MLRTLASLLRLAPLALAASVLAQGPSPKEPPPPDWPPLSGEQTARVKSLIGRLGDAEQAAAAEADLIGIGAAAAPRLIAELGHREPTAPDALLRILDRIVTPEYAPRVAAKVKSKSAAVRGWAIGTLALLHDVRWQAVLVKASEDEDPLVSFRAVAGLVGLEQLDALEVLFARCAADWRSHAEFTARAIAPARGTAATRWVLDHMPKDDELARVTGLRLLRSLAPPEFAGVVATYLDSDQFAVKKEAINALRAIVDGDEPLEDLPVFQAIELAKKWKARIR